MIVSASLLTLSSCGDDSNVIPSGESETLNVNANTTVKGNEMQRVEVPHLADGRKLILIKRTSAYGINYIVEWDCDLKAQRWSCWEWDDTNSVKNWNRNNWKGSTWMGVTWTGDPFQSDPAIPQQYRTELTDYRSTGYSRGHICASEDRICNQDVNGQTFFLSNIQPQINSFNAGVCSNMEMQLRKWNNSSFRDKMWVCKGGTIGKVMLDGKEQSGTIASVNINLIVPKYFYMAVVVKKGESYKGMAFWAEHKSNSDTSLAKYIISIDELEERTGIDFFCNLPDKIEDALESKSAVTASSWGLQ